VLKYHLFVLNNQEVGMSKSKLLNIRIDPDLKKRAKKLAEADGRSLSNWVTNLISSQVKEAEKKDQKSNKKDG
jgi:predicted HicB family RNase H-like nuclease